MEVALQHTSAPRNHTRPIAVFIAAFVLAVEIHANVPLPIDGNGAGWLQRVLGCALLAGGTALVVWCLQLFRRLGTGIMPHRPATHLVTFGPYAHTRHPMFVGFAVMYAGLALIVNVIWPLLFLPLVLGLLNVTVVRCEERYMQRTFGPAYDRYAARVPRWL
jgi:protein-S-isoprenylcysteine O-methyltransferase Ste14